MDWDVDPGFGNTDDSDLGRLALVRGSRPFAVGIIFALCVLVAS